MTEEQHAEVILRAAFPSMNFDLTTIAAKQPRFLTALRAYGDERAADMREMAAGVPDARAKGWGRVLKDGGPKRLHMSRQEVFTAKSENEVAAINIRALPLQEPKP